MAFWILVAIIGIIISYFGLIIVYRKYRHKKISGRYFLAIIVGYLSFLTYAILSSFQPEITNGIVVIAILFPAFIAILVVIHEHQKRNVT